MLCDNTKAVVGSIADIHSYHIHCGLLKGEEDGPSSSRLGGYSIAAIDIGYRIAAKGTGCNIATIGMVVMLWPLLGRKQIFPMFI